MNDSETLKICLVNLLSKTHSTDAAIVADTIEALIDVKFAELLDQLSERLEKIPR